MTDEQKLTLLLKVLKEYAEMKHCYNYGEDYTPSAGSYDDAFAEGIDYGEIHLARTLLEQIGEKFEYPCMKENDDGSFTINWDSNDPVESIMNDWTEEDFIDAIMGQCDRVLQEKSND